MTHPVSTFVTLFGLLLAQAALNHRLISRPSAPETEDAPSGAGERRWDPRLIRILSFGFLPVSVDWLWIQALVDPSAVRLPRGRHPPQYYRADLATDLDPAFFDAYYAASQLLAVIHDDDEGALAILEKAERFAERELPGLPAGFSGRYWNGRWFLGVTRAYVHLFELSDMPAAARAFLDAAALSGAPEYLRRLAARLREPGGEYEVGMRLLNFLIGQAREPLVRRKLETQRKHLFIAQYVHGLQRAFRAFLLKDPGPGRAGESLRARWARFLRETGASPIDPWGGRLSIDAEGRVFTTTPYERVFNLP